MAGSCVLWLLCYVAGFTAVSGLTVLAAMVRTESLATVQQLVLSSTSHNTSHRRTSRPGVATHYWYTVIVLCTFDCMITIEYLNTFNRWRADIFSH